jgi:hypothetical protein
MARYRTPEEIAEISRKREAYYAALAKGEAKLPQHDFKAASDSASIPPPGARKRAATVEFSAIQGMLPVDTSVVEKGALVEGDDDVGLKPAAGVPTFRDVVHQDDPVRSALDSSSAATVPTTAAQIDKAAEQGVLPTAEPERVTSALDGSVPNEIPTTDVQDKVAQEQGVDTDAAKEDGVVDPNAVAVAQQGADSSSDDAVAIPDNWKELPWNDVRSLARNFTDGVVTNRQSAWDVIEAELKRRSEA